jgi:hypothetical protein
VCSQDQSRSTTFVSAGNLKFSEKTKESSDEHCLLVQQKDHKTPGNWPFSCALTW